MNTIKHKLPDIAKALTLSTRRIQQLVKNDILPAPVNGNYDLVGCIRAYEKYLQQQVTNKNNNTGNLHTQKLRLLKAQADKAELEVAILESKYFEGDLVNLVKKPISKGFVKN